MFSRTITRFFHTCKPCWAAEKSNLAILRKKTGYTFANCKKALELHNNDTVKAEAWLKEQAQALGWSKATKLEGRRTTQGLVGVVLKNRTAALVEVNCETDFVARNATFQETVETVANACFNFAEKQRNSNGPVTKIGLDAEQLKSLQTLDGKTLADHVALMIGTVGENATLRRGFSLKTNTDNISLYAYAHPSGNQKGNVLLGRIAGVVALRQIAPKETDLDSIGKGLCQHIVGMNPKKIGSSLDDKPAKDSDDEMCLIYQEFIENPEFTVQEVLEENGVEVVDFKRFECGENLEEDEQPLELRQTCQ